MCIDGVEPAYTVLNLRNLDKAFCLTATEARREYWRLSVAADPACYSSTLTGASSVASVEGSGASPTSAAISEPGALMGSADAGS